MSAVDAGERCAIGAGEIIRGGHQNAAQRRKRLRVTQHGFALLRIGEQFGQPRDGGHEFHADADEAERAPHQQRFDRRRESRGDRRQRIQKDAPDQHGTASEAVGKIAADESEESAREWRNPEKVSGPLRVPRRAEFDSSQVVQRGAEDQGTDQDRVNVEQETDGGHRADEPLHGPQTNGCGNSRGRGHRNWSAYHNDPGGFIAKRSGASTVACEIALRLVADDVQRRRRP